MAKRKKLISLLLFVLVILVVFLQFSIQAGGGGAHFNISSQDDTHPEVIEWMAESDISGKGVYVLRLSRERADEFFFPSSAGPIIPDEYIALIYINSFENDDIERVFGRFEMNGSSLSVSYQTKGSNGHFENTYIYDDYGYPHELYFNNDIFSGYELSLINAEHQRFLGNRVIASGITELEIFIDGEKVDFHESMLD